MLNIGDFVKLLIISQIFISTYSTNSVFRSPDGFFQSVARPKRYVTYPSGTAIGLLVAIALPIEVPEENLYFSLNFEANYNLPDNITQYYNSDIARLLRGITRRSTYGLIENQLSKLGHNGEVCLLRMICETAATNLPFSGLLETVFSIIFRTGTIAVFKIFDAAVYFLSNRFTKKISYVIEKAIWGGKEIPYYSPSQSQYESSMKKYTEAEEFGLISENCTKIYKNCDTSIFNLFSRTF